MRENDGGDLHAEAERAWFGTFAEADPASPSAPAAVACDLSDPEKRAVAEVNDGETLTLTDGTVVRLVGAKAPSAPLGWRGDQPWPIVAEAKEALSQLASGRRGRAPFRRHQSRSSVTRLPKCSR
jgi:endonuclease YncB( thermonuclease family)